MVTLAAFGATTLHNTVAAAPAVAHGVAGAASAAGAAVTGAKGISKITGDRAEENYRLEQLDAAIGRAEQLMDSLIETDKESTRLCLDRARDKSAEAKAAREGGKKLDAFKRGLGSYAEECQTILQELNTYVAKANHQSNQ